MAERIVGGRMKEHELAIHSIVQVSCSLHPGLP